MYQQTAVLLTFLVLFSLLPLLNPLLGIAIPLNESRRREQILKGYYYVDDEYFYAIYIHGTICAVGTILTVITVDSLYMIIVHHAAGLFAVCGSDHSVLQKDERSGASVFSIPYYKTLKKYLIFLGQSPSQTNLRSNINVTLIITISISIILPSLFQILLSLSNKDWDGATESLPQLITAINSIVKLLSLHLNRQNFKDIFVSVKEVWDELKLADEQHHLDVLTERGSKIAQLYRTVLLTFLVLFSLLPLFNPLLDIAIPLNESRRREQILKAYYYVDDDEYFYAIYIHGTICAFGTILIIVTVDSLYMIIVHHAAGLFAVCGYKIRKAAENNNMIKNGDASRGNEYEDFRQCVIVHNKAIKFFEFLDNLNRKNYLAQIGLNMIGISITAFQAMVHLHEPDQAFRYGVFFTGQNFHLFIISLPGQVLLDYSLDLGTNIYMSEWYQTPSEVQRLLRMMQIRCSKPCSLTAGGLYEMNIQNFGATFKTCMSYFTMLLSTKQ
ncbi:uncharacterized protein LOC143349091 [Colletes latitarsis]|uniref:uncharacterized protein LOC143349091 n=1 Tax=Colletes latitarsis TaxID=2605962 RepID=UPI004035A5B8